MAGMGGDACAAFCQSYDIGCQLDNADVCMPVTLHTASHTTDTHKQPGTKQISACPVPSQADNAAVGAPRLLTLCCMLYALRRRGMRTHGHAWHAGTVLDRDLAGDYRPGWLRRPAARAVLPFLQDVWLRKVRLQALPREQEVAFSGTGARV